MLKRNKNKTELIRALMTIYRMGHTPKLEGVHFMPFIQTDKINLEAFRWAKDVIKDLIQQGYVSPITYRKTAKFANLRKA